MQMSATAAPEEATDKSVAWTSSNPEIASVDENGLVTTKAAGNVTITATAKDKDGKSGSMELTVKAALEYHESTEANCSTDGNLEYWSDAEGNLYADAEGKISTSLEEIKIPPLGMITGLHGIGVRTMMTILQQQALSVRYVSSRILFQQK